MNTEAVVLVLVAAGLHAAWNLTLHGSEDRLAVMAVSGLVGGVLLLPGLVLSPPTGVLALVAVSGAAESLYGASLSAAYRRGQLSLTYPLARGTAPLVVTGLGVVVLAERPGATAVAGAAALAGGLATLAVSGRRARAGAAVAFGMLTGVVIACYSVVDARAVRTASPAGYLAAVLLVQGVLLGSTLRWDRRRLLRSAATGSGVAVFSVGAYLLVLLAFQRAAAGRVATLREVSVLIGLLAARERPRRAVWIGAALVVAGAALAGR
ncbi:MAG TPA: EamA family transporter [Acidimicrobiales bacterium]|nr:EamA family transporter [Acidimicrobiales bacterium]